MTQKLLLGTSNLGKINEFKKILQNIPYELTTLEEESCNIEVIETNIIVFEINNAIKKESIIQAFNNLNIFLVSLQLSINCETSGLIFKLDDDGVKSGYDIKDPPLSLISRTKGKPPTSLSEV